MREQPRATSASRVDPRALRVPMHARAAERAFHLAYAPYPIQLTVARKYTVLWSMPTHRRYAPPAPSVHRTADQQSGVSKVYARRGPRRGRSLSSLASWDSQGTRLAWNPSPGRAMTESSCAARRAQAKKI